MKRMATKVLFSSLGLLFFLFASLVRVDGALVIKGTPEINDLWVQDGLVDDATPMKLFIALKEQNVDLVEQQLSKTSDPNSSEYGKHMSFEELTALTGATPEQIKAVTAWLEAHDIEYEVTPSRSFVRVQTTARSVSNLLKCNLRYFKSVVSSSSSSKRVIRCMDPYLVPEEIDPMIDFIAPIHGFPRLVTKAKASRGVESSSSSVSRSHPVEVTPDVLRTLYNVTLPLTNMNVNNTQGVFESGDNFSPNDLQKFFTNYAPALEGQEITRYLGNEKNKPDGRMEGEATLDVEYIMAMGSFAPTYYYAYDNTSDIFELFYEYVVTLANDPNPPLVHSISYGDYGGHYPLEAVLRVSNEWMKLGARGITTFVASGDDGVGCDRRCNSFEFPYPSSPYITLVGGTVVRQNTTNDDMYEIAWGNGLGASSGGFSGDFSIPSWQSKQVAEYLKQPNLPTKYFNSSGRGLPDLSAPADDVLIIIHGSISPIGGTSCASPIVAGLFSMINGVRLQAGKSSVGFINPAIYQLSSENAAAFHDITEGSNPDGCCPGFPATKGWDAVTGLGTPNFGELLSYFSRLP